MKALSLSNTSNSKVTLLSLRLSFFTNPSIDGLSFNTSTSTSLLTSTVFPSA